MRIKIKVDKKQIVCILLGITFCLAGIYVDSADSVLKDGHLLERNSYGLGEKEQEVQVEGLGKDKVPVRLLIRERQYGQEELRTVFAQAGETLAEKILGENESLERITGDLELVTWLPEFGISVRWETEDSVLIESTGIVHSENCPEEGADCVLTAILKAGDGNTDTYEFRARVFPPFLTPEEARQRAFGKLLALRDEEQRTEAYLALPEEYEGQALTYSVEETSDRWIFPVLGILAALLLPLRERQKQRDEKKKRERQMLMDYSEIVSKLTVFLGAGLPVRRAWERIVLDYEEKGRKVKETRYAYEEMKTIYYMMGRGLPEIRAYSEFGSRCGLLPYRKLAGLLEQNVKNGSERLRPMLEAEMENAFEQRKTLARRMGEEAGTKLLLPLFLMLGIVMVIITVPAFLSFGL